jgi:uncharacterized protein YjbJ (UPF0337 family)
MNWTQVQGRWGQVKGKIRSSWAKLTDDDLTNVAGKRDVLVGKIVERYGLLKEQAERDVDAWIARLPP